MKNNHDNISNVIYLPTPETMTLEQRRHWIGQAALHELLKDQMLEMAEFHDRARQDALRMLGMIGIENGLTEA